MFLQLCLEFNILKWRPVIIDVYRMSVASLKMYSYSVIKSDIINKISIKLISSLYRYFKKKLRIIMKY